MCRACPGAYRWDAYTNISGNQVSRRWDAGTGGVCINAGTSMGNLCISRYSRSKVRLFIYLPRS